MPHATHPLLRRTRWLLLPLLACGVLGCDGGSSRAPSAEPSATVVEAPTAPATSAAVVASSTSEAPLAEVPAQPATLVVLAGRAVLEDGRPAAGTCLVVSSRTSGLVPTEVDPAALLCDDDGRFALTLPRDAYELVAVHPEGGVAKTQVELRADQRDLALTLRPDERALFDLLERGPPEEAEAGAPASASSAAEAE